jgi:outer membrane protein assembly factor BamB
MLNFVWQAAMHPPVYGSRFPEDVMRIKTFCLFFLVILTTALASGQAVTRCGGPNNALYINWPTFGFDVCHTGYNPYEYRINTTNVKDLVVAWQYGPGPFNSPVLANGVVYFGGANVYAVDSGTGTLLWTYNTGSNVQYPTVFNNVLYFGSGQSVYALDAKAGTLLWTYSITGTFNTGSTVADGVVYIGSYDGSNSTTTIYALDAKNGTLRWKRTYSSGGVISTPAVVNGVVYFFAGGEIYALNAKSGAVVWQVSGFSTNNAVAVFNNFVYVSSGGLYALNALTGAVVWTAQPQAGTFSSSPVVGNGVVYIGAATDRQHPGSLVYSFDATNGSLLWPKGPGQGYGGIYYLALANGVLYASVSGPTDWLDAMSAADGTGLWGYQNADGNAFIIANGMLYTPSWDTQYFYAFHLPN